MLIGSLAQISPSARLYVGPRGKRRPLVYKLTCRLLTKRCLQLQICFAAFMYPVARFLNNTGYFVHQWDVPLSKISEFSYVSLVACSVTITSRRYLREYVPKLSRGGNY